MSGIDFIQVDLVHNRAIRSTASPLEATPLASWHHDVQRELFAGQPVHLSRPYRCIYRAYERGAVSATGSFCREEVAKLGTRRHARSLSGNVSNTYLGLDTHWCCRFDASDSNVPRRGMMQVKHEPYVRRLSALLFDLDMPDLNYRPLAVDILRSWSFCVCTRRVLSS